MLAVADIFILVYTKELIIYSFLLIMLFFRSRSILNLRSLNFFFFNLNFVLGTATLSRLNLG